MAITKDSIIRLNSDGFANAAHWFHNKWSIPEQAYLDSMDSSLASTNGVPQWYTIVNEEDQIIAGLGVIENDFHKRCDLAPNICAVFVETEYRHQGIARMLLDYVCMDLSYHGITNVYLITSHSEFYEHCGWTFYGMIEENDGNLIRMYQHNLNL